MRLIGAASNNNATLASINFNFVYMFDIEMPCIYVIIEGLMEDWHCQMNSFVKKKVFIIIIIIIIIPIIQALGFMLSEKNIFQDLPI